MKIRKAAEKNYFEMMKIARKLHPKWFDRVAIKISIPLDLKLHRGFVAEENNKVIGFVTYTSIPDEGQVKLSWIGVDPKFQGKGIGTKLIKKLENELVGIGVKQLWVGTVAESTVYEPYEKTRAFYKKVGFRVTKVKKIKSKDTGKKFDFALLVKDLTKI